MTKQTLLTSIKNATDDIEIIRLLRANNFEGAKIIWGSYPTRYRFWATDNPEVLNHARAIKQVIIHEHPVAFWKYKLEDLILADDVKKYILDNTNL